LRITMEVTILICFYRDLNWIIVRVNQVWIVDNTSSI